MCPRARGDTLRDKGYAAFFAHRAMKLSDASVKIYVAKKTSATQVELVELEDHIIPAATAVILQADGAKELTLEGNRRSRRQGKGCRQSAQG